MEAGRKHESCKDSINFSERNSVMIGEVPKTPSYYQQITKMLVDNEARKISDKKNAPTVDILDISIFGKVKNIIQSLPDVRTQKLAEVIVRMESVYYNRPDVEEPMVNKLLDNRFV